MTLDLPEPVSPTTRKCLFSALRGTRNGRLSSFVVMPMPSPATAFGYMLYIPIFGWYRPNGSYTEGLGVQPDVPVDIDPETLARGSDAQMNKALEILE